MATTRRTTDTRARSGPHRAAWVALAGAVLLQGATAPGLPGVTHVP